MPLKILIFEDNVALRLSLKTLLIGVEGYTVAGDYSNCKNAKEITETILPDIVIMDIDMPEVNGIEGLKIIKETKPDTQIIMHTVFDDDQRLFDCLCYGASGYILKNTTFSKLIEAIDTVQKGGSPLSPLIARKVLNSFHQEEKTNSYSLSKRELEILGLMVQGFSYKMIADACFISIDTVRGHVRNIYTKLHVNCGKAAVAKALKEKIVH